MKPHICYIVPPHILNKLAQHPEHRERATRALVESARLRGRRDVLAQFASMLAVPSGTERRTIYDAQGQTNLPGVLVRGEGDAPTADPAVNEAYDFAGDTYDFYLKAYQRNSIDGQGMRLDSSVHYDQQFDNAFWDGRQMVYGDGDQQVFDRFTKCLDVIGHELTHGVTAATAGLNYSGQTGALNESMSDVFGSLVKQMKLNQTAAQADWLIGQGLLMPSIHGVALRSMKNPGSAYNDPLLGADPQPNHMSNYVNTNEDNGGVHINSGIPNKAFCLAAIQIGGNAWEKAGRIWYVTLTQRLQANSDFQDAANHTYEVAATLFGQGSAEQQAVGEGWSQVGIDVGKPSAGVKSMAPARTVAAVAGSKKTKVS